MSHYPKTNYRFFLLIALFLVAALAIPSIISAQATPTPAPDGTPIEISGVVSQIGTGTITVAGMTIDVSGVALDAGVTVGTTVRVTGHILSTNVVVAQVIIIVNISGTVTPTPEATSEATPEQTPEATASATPANPDIIIIIEGPVTNIVTNIITIYSFDIEIEPAHPMLNIIEIGDVVHIEGAFGNSGIIVASLVSNVSTTVTVATGVTANIEGPIESINGNIIIVNSIPVQFDPNDPNLAGLQVGDFLNIQGNFENNGTIIVLVVVNITIINNVVIEGNPLCWYHEGMGMGHWHCDGMGMGMGMGMGDEGMGMGR
jgi:hypothetical protein